VGISAADQDGVQIPHAEIALHRSRVEGGKAEADGRGDPLPHPHRERRSRRPARHQPREDAEGAHCNLSHRKEVQRRTGK